MPQRFRFSSSDDIALLQQVRQEVPFTSNVVVGEVDRGWQRIASNLREQGLQVETRTVKDRFALLYKKFLDEDIAGLKRGGSDADYQQKETLLLQISEIIRQVDVGYETKFRKRHYDPSNMTNQTKKHDDIGDPGNENDSTQTDNLHEDTYAHAISVEHVDSVLSIDDATNRGLLNDSETSIERGSGRFSHLGNDANIINGIKRQKVLREPRVTQEALLLVLQSLERQKHVELALRERELAAAEAKLQIERENLELAKAREARENTINAARDEQLKLQLSLLQQLVSRNSSSSDPPDPLTNEGP